MAKGKAPMGDVAEARSERSSGPFRLDSGSDIAVPGSACRFLVGQDPDGTLRPASSLVDPAHRCVALGDAVAQSSRQQELVCLDSGHVNCPRYLRGILLAATPPPPPPRASVSPAVIGAALVLVAALAASFGFLAIRGGFGVTLAIHAPSAAVASPPSPSAVATVEGPPSPSPDGRSSPSPTPLATASPSAAPTPPVTPPATATPRPATPTPAPPSNRFAYLTPCPSTADCWIYVVRSGDNLRSIANYFGVSYERILAMNPTITDPTTIYAGQRLRIPTPTR